MFIQVDNVATSSADFAVDSGRPMSGETSLSQEHIPQIMMTVRSEDKMLMMVP